MLKRKLVCCFSSLCLLFCMGCKKHEFYYMQNKEDIESIAIVQVLTTDYTQFEIVPLLLIEDQEAFLSDFSKLNWTTVFSYSYEIKDGSIAIKFQYSNGNYELVTNTGMAKYYHAENRYSPISGDHICDEEEYQQLLAKYLEGET